MPRRPIRSGFALALAAALVAVPACGGDDDGEDEAERAAATARAYFEGLAQGNGQKSCDQLTAEGEQVLAKRAQGAGLKGGCVVALTALGESLPPEGIARLARAAGAIDADGVEIDSGVATIEVPESDTPLQLEEEDGEWRITADTLRASFGAQSP